MSWNDQEIPTLVDGKPIELPEITPLNIFVALGEEMYLSRPDKPEQKPKTVSYEEVYQWTRRQQIGLRGGDRGIKAILFHIEQQRFAFKMRFGV